MIDRLFTVDLRLMKLCFRTDCQSPGFHTQGHFEERFNPPGQQTIRLLIQISGQNLTT